MKYSQKVMVITGTRKGIGRFLAEHYLSLGWKVYGVSREPGDIKHPNYVESLFDVSSELQVKNLMNKIREIDGHLDAIINNAGIASMNHILTTPLKTVESVFRTNFLGTFLVLREGAKIMAKNGGSIINFTTIARPLYLEGEAIYAASKSAIETLSKIAAKELAPFKITVNAIGPTPVDTDLVRSVPAAKMEHLISIQPIKRYGTMEDVSNCVDFFLQEKSSFITGQIIYLGGI